ncbi:MAG: peptide chain release factor N(5)-glutamine methyltransferase [Pseudomonadota bacterium]
MHGTIGEHVRDGTARLEKAGIPTPQDDTVILLAHVLQLDRTRLLAQHEDQLTTLQLATFLNAMDQRALRVPVSQILGKRAFWKHEFQISNAVLDPRPDTETLVEAALTTHFDSVLDLGTGSGCILLSLLAEREQATGLGVDCSRKALDVAKANRAALELTERATLQHSDWFSTVEGRFDLIVSNPPYITDAAFEMLAPEVKEHEPRIALTPGGDGLAAYRAITRKAAAYLNPQGRLLVEIGFDQGKPVSGLFEEAGFSQIRVLPDLNGKDRVVAAKIR